MQSRLRVCAFIDETAPENWEADLSAELTEVADIETYRVRSSDRDLPLSLRAVDRLVAGARRHAAGAAPRAVDPSDPVDLHVDATAQGIAGTHQPARRMWRVVFGERGRTYNQAITATMCRSSHEPLRVQVDSSSRRSALSTPIAVAHLPCDPVSVSRNRTRAWWATRDLLVRSIRDLQASGEEPVARESTSPDAVEMIHPLRAVGRGLALRARLRLQPEQWSIEIGQYTGALHSLSRQATNSLRPPRDELWADPFIIERDGQGWVFFEACALRGGRGVIAAGRVTEAGLAEVRTVLRRPYHLSYPYVLAHGGELWMVPECAEIGQVELYRCREFPDRWTREAVLLTGTRALDPTIAHHDGRFWLWAAIARGDGAAAQLHLFHSETLLGPWHAHERNPVITDCRSLRPAGSPFVLDGVLVRPAQCAIPRYGSAVIFNAVDELSPTSYAERPIARLEASAWPAATGVHHFSRAGRLQAFDVRRRRRCPRCGFIERHAKR